MNNFPILSHSCDRYLVWTCLDVFLYTHTQFCPICKETKRKPKKTTPKKTQYPFLELQNNTRKQHNILQGVYKPKSREIPDTCYRTPCSLRFQRPGPTCSPAPIACSSVPQVHARVPGQPTGVDPLAPRTGAPLARGARRNRGGAGRGSCRFVDRN